MGAGTFRGRGRVAGTRDGERSVNRTLRVQRALKMERAWQPRVLGPTKTRKPKVLPLGHHVQSVLAQHRRTQVARRLLLGSAYNDQDFIFTNDVGGPIDFSSIR